MLMPWLSALGLCLAAGWFLARMLTAGARFGPRWAALLFEVSLGALFGPGLASVLYFALVRAGLATEAGVFATLIAFAGACGAAWWKLTPRGLLPAAPAGKYRWIWALWIAVAVGVVFLSLDIQTAASANPTGQWDAMAVWNLRARFLASGGELWRRALTEPPAPHPGYPLFLSGFIGLQWGAGGVFDDTVPILAGGLLAAAVFLMLGSSVAFRKSPALGLLAWLVLLASEVFASQVAVQYSDIPQGLAFLAVIVLLEAAAGTPSVRLCIAAGLAIGLCCWIKNEGVPFAVGALGIALWRFRARGIPWLALGAAPGLLATLILKLFVAQGRDPNMPSTVAAALANFLTAGRWWQAGLGFGKAVFEAGAWWSHPVLLGAVLALALRFVPAQERRARLWLWVPVAATVAVEYLQYLITDVDLHWQIEGSANRLIAQLWPSLIWLFFLMLRAPEDLAEVPVKAPSPASKRSKR
jgi:hypothetical protein